MGEANFQSADAMQMIGKFFVLLFVCGCFALRINPLTDKNFTSVTDRGDWLGRFCIKGDSQCEETQPKWRALEDQPAFSRLAEVDCEQSPETCKKERIQKYPFYILYNDQVLPHGANRLPNVPESEELPYTHFLEQWTIMTIRGNIKTL